MYLLVNFYTHINSGLFPIGVSKDHGFLLVRYDPDILTYLLGVKVKARLLLLSLV